MSKTIRCHHCGAPYAYGWQDHACTKRHDFVMSVAQRLMAENHAPAFTDNESALILYAFEHGVGAGETACQIIANRADLGETV